MVSEDRAVSLSSDDRPRMDIAKKKTKKTEREIDRGLLFVRTATIYSGSTAARDRIVSRTEEMERKERIFFAPTPMVAAAP